jgi:hypothetical protein
MSRLGGAFWFILVVATGMTNFLVKQTVQGLDDQLTQVKRKTVEDQKKIHDLTADWTFLNQPEHLADLNNRYVHLAAVSPKQVVTSLDGIPMRTLPAPEEAAPPAVAEVAAPAPPPAPITAFVPPPTQVAAAAPNPARAPAIAPATPLSLISTAHAATAPAAAPVPRAQPAAPASSGPSLNGIFAQVTGKQ